MDAIDARPSVIELFQRWVRAGADRPALIDGAGRLSYGELNARANRLARWLRGRGVGPDIVVGLHTERGADLVVGSLAVLKAGGAYLPMDPANPAERVARMLADARARLVLCGAEHADRLRTAGAEPVRLDAPPGAEESTLDLEPVARPDHAAYVVYTSGSTGTPKGVVVPHAALAHLVARVGAAYGLRPGDRAGLACSPSFDVSVSEVWLPLTSGAAIDVPEPEWLLSPEATIRWLVERQVTITVLPTPLAERALRAPWPRTGLALHTLLTGGDRLHVRPDPALPFRLINNYGPTENTVISTFGAVSPAGESLPTIGRPVPGTMVEILDEELRPCEAGELYLGGPQLARCYLGRPDLTADRFVPHPTRPGERLYRTGDLGRWLPGGEIEFLGRTDDQVKLRGHRIELGEVTAALAEHPDLTAAHVQVHEDRLVAYVVPADPRRLPAASELRRHLQRRLPAFMVPAAYVTLAALPLSTNGKVDRAALPEPDLRRLADPARYVAPRTPTERTIAAIWRDVLGLDRVGSHDTFGDLGGHSLLATQIVARMNEAFGVDVPVGEVFRRPTVAELASFVDAPGDRAPGLPPIEPGSGSTVSPLSVAQQQVWFLAGLAPGNTAYQAQATIRVVGPLDLDVLARALTEISRRHESLRTTYEERDGRPVQVVRPPADYPLGRVDLSDVPAGSREARLDELVRAEMARPFDLGRLPVSRWTAVRLGPHEHELILVEHHLVHDGWSFAVLVLEMEALYTAYAAGLPSPLPEPPVQFRDHVRWQRDLLASPVMERQVAYWRYRLAGARELSLPTDRPRSDVPGFRGRVLRLDVPPRVATGIRELCRGAMVSPFMTMYAAFVALLHRYTGTGDICVASGFANRRRPEAEALIGMLVNPVVLRVEVDGTTPFRALLARARDAVLDAAAHQECPFPLVVQALGGDRDASRNPLTQVMFSAHDAAVRHPEFGAATGTVYERSNDTAKVDLNVIVVPRAQSQLGRREHTDDRITVLWEYDGDLFDEGTMRDMSEAYLRVLAAAVASPATTVGRLPVLDARQTRAVLVDRNPGLGLVPRPGPPVPDLVAARAAEEPDALAVTDGDRRLSYGELDRRSGLVAAALRAAGVGPGAVVALRLPRGPDLVLAELSVLRAGAAFLPLDPTLPDERLNHLITSASAHPPGLIMSLLADTPGVSANKLMINEGEAAYVVYTSGSTGEPKGVVVQHDTLASFAAWHRGRFGVDRRDRVALVGSPGFDLSVWEIWPALTAGASLHAPAAETLLSPPDLRRWLVEQGITIALLPTPIAETLLARPWPDTGRLRLLHAGGDRLTVRPPAGLGVEVYNSYGPTEVTVLSTTGPVEPEAGQARPPDIGTPIAGNTAYLLDAELNPVPAGAVGEIYLGGVELARGYLGRPDLTADRFVPDPFAARPGARLYRTGDLGRHLPGGAIDFVGRGDDQVQIRGHRVEPAEVTAALRAIEGVADAYTTAHDDRLVAYVVPAGLDPAVLRAHLSRLLPAWMVPAAFVSLTELPRTPSGKVDRRALPAPEPAGGGPVVGHRPPTTRYERAIARIWADLLGLPRVGVDDRFFDIGGHSLLLADVRTRIAHDLDRHVTLLDLFQHPTVASLAAHLENGDGAADSDTGTEDGVRRRQGLDRLRRRRSLVDSG